MKDYTPSKLSEVVCLKCLQRWIAVRPESTKLKELECPNCGKQGFAIETGEDLKSDDLKAEVIKH